MFTWHVLCLSPDLFTRQGNTSIIEWLLFNANWHCTDQPIKVAAKLQKWRLQSVCHKVCSVTVCSSAVIPYQENPDTWCRGPRDIVLWNEKQKIQHHQNSSMLKLENCWNRGKIDTSNTHILDRSFWHFNK